MNQRWKSPWMLTLLVTTIGLALPCLSTTRLVQTSVLSFGVIAVTAKDVEMTHTATEAETDPEHPFEEEGEPPESISVSESDSGDEIDHHIHENDHHDPHDHHSHNEEGEEHEKRSPYFYKDLPDHPVTEYELPEDGDVWAHHQWLLEVDPKKHRIVELYAHWCPHCQHIFPWYVMFARRMRDVAKEYNIDVEVYAINCVFHKPICQHYDIHAYPRMYLIRAGESEHIRLSHVDLHPYQMLRRIGVDTDEEDEEEDEEATQKELAALTHQKAAAPGQDHWLPRTKKDVYNDAYLSFQFAMKNGIFQDLTGSLANSTKDVLVDFLDVLRATMPPSFKLQRLAADIIDNAETAFANESSLVAIVDKYPPKKKTWSFSCTRGDPAMGYTCGLWNLFHIMTIGFVEYNRMVPTEDDYPFYRPAGTARSLRNFIENFFGCEVCRTHFVQAFDACAYDGCTRLAGDVGEMPDWLELPLWLFEFHNGVNSRLMKEKAEREGRTPKLPQDAISVEWPSRKECPMCWYDDGTYEPINVAIFLRLTYWPDDIHLEGMKRDLENSQLNQARKKKLLQRRLKLGSIPVLMILAVMGARVFFKYRHKQNLAHSKKHP